MRKIALKTAFIILTVVILILSLGMSSALAAGNRAGNGNGNTGTVQVTALNADEIYWITYMREEEKLARDIYDVCYDKWRLRIFDKISSSEQNHMDAILKMLNKYGEDDPALEPGKFSNEDLQDDYDELFTRIEEGDVIEALKVGVDIELLDIDDLVEALEVTEDIHVDIENVYNNLMDGSYRHLAAFQSNLEKRGVIYPEN